MGIRPVNPDDAEAVVSLTAPLDPTIFATAETFRALLAQPGSPSTERLVAEVDGAIVAWAPSGQASDGSGWFGVTVAPAHRRSGIGGALYERIEHRLRRLGAPTVSTQILDEDGRRFLERRGFKRTNVQRLQALDLEAATLPEPAPSTALREFDPWLLFDLYQQGHSDIPSHTPRPPFVEDDFRRDVVDDATLDHDVSCVILEDDVPVAFTLVVASRAALRGGAAMTAVDRDRRGHGLAYAVKVASLHRARAAGLRTMITSNDLENAPMLAVNRKLGFEPTILLENFEKPLS